MQKLTSWIILYTF